MKIKSKKKIDKENFKTIMCLANKKSKFLVFLICILIFIGNILFVLPSEVSADGGYVPYYFDEFSVYEPGQKAILAWNGSEEIMALSVDVLSEVENKVLHMVPLPSLPNVTLGNISMFETLNDMLADYFPYGGESEAEAEGENDGTEDHGFEIEFHEQIGAHNITVVKVLNPEQFTNWVTNYLNNQGISDVKFLSGTKDVVKHYTDQNINYFVFDEIEITTETYSIDPIIYRFQSDCIYFPLVISSIIEGNSEINIALITPEDLPINSEKPLDLGFTNKVSFRIDHKEIELISPEIAELIPDDGYINYYENVFQLKDLKSDLKLYPMDDVNWMASYDHTINDLLYHDCNADGLDDLLFYAEGNICVLNSKNGDVLWAYDVKSSYNLYDLQIIDIDSDNIKDVLGLLTVKDGNNNYLKVVAMDKKSGILKWQYTSKEKIDIWYDHSKSLSRFFNDIDSDGKSEFLLYFKSIGKYHLVAINEEDGTELWNEVVTNEEYEEVYDCKIVNINQHYFREIILTTSHRIMVLEGWTGKVIWEKVLNYNQYDFHLRKNLDECIYDFDLDGELEILISPYGESQSGRLWMMNGKNGNKEWEYFFGETSRDSDSRSDNGWAISDKYSVINVDSDPYMEIIRFTENNIYAINSEKGSLLWETTDNPIGGWVNRKTYYYDVDSDGKLEIIITFDNQITVFNGENGGILWKKTLNDHHYYDISEIFIDDVNSDNKFEIIFGYGNKMYALSGVDGNELWSEFVIDEEFHYYEIRIQSDMKDFDHDGSLELIFSIRHDLCMIDCYDGTIDWRIHEPDSNSLALSEILDVDSNGEIEFIVNDEKTVFVINPITGHTLWSFTCGDIFGYYNGWLIDCNTIYDHFYITMNERCYSVKLDKLPLAISTDKTIAKGGDIINFRLYMGYWEPIMDDIDFSVTDHSVGGAFYTVENQYPRVYEFEYYIPDRAYLPKVINISIEAIHPDYFGATRTIYIDIGDNNSLFNTDIGSNPIIFYDNNKKILFVNANTTSTKLNPGETTTVIFKVDSSYAFSDSDLMIRLFDGEVNGTFSEIKWYSIDYMKFKYTVPEDINTDKISIIILASHDGFYDGLGFIELLVINNNSTNGDDNLSGMDDENKGFRKNDNLTFELSSYPDTISPGGSNVILIYALDNTHDTIDTNSSNGVEIDNIEIYDIDLGGTISAITQHYDGHYSFVYTLPSGLSTKKSLAYIMVYIYLENQLTYSELLEIPIIHLTESEEEPLVEKFTLDMYSNPYKLNSGESAIVVVKIVDRPENIPLSGITVTLDAGDAGGEIILIGRYSDGRFIFDYRPPDSVFGIVELRAIAYFQGKQETNAQTTIDITYVKSDKNEDISYVDAGKDQSMLFYSVIFLVFTVGIMIGVFSLFSYAYYFGRKKKIDSNTKAKVNDKKDNKKELKK